MYVTNKVLAVGFRAVGMPTTLFRTASKNRIKSRGEGGNCWEGLFWDYYYRDPFLHSLPVLRYRLSYTTVYRTWPFPVPKNQRNLFGDLEKGLAAL